MIKAPDYYLIDYKDVVNKDFFPRQRLHYMTEWLKEHRDLFANRTVLDLGSNAGHFPLLYAAHGAKSVTAVEPRKAFKKFFDEKLKGFPESDKIQWVVGAAEDYSPPRQFDVVSCLGLLYHMGDGWKHLARIVNQCDARAIVLELTLWSEPHRALETCRVEQNTHKLITVVEHPSFESVEEKLSSLGWKHKAVMRNWTSNCPRAMWLVDTGRAL